MIITTAMARADWVARVEKQADQLLIIAAATNDDRMREELLTYAVRLEQHAAAIAKGE